MGLAGDTVAWSSNGFNGGVVDLNLFYLEVDKKRKINDGSTKSANECKHYLSSDLMEISENFDIVCIGGKWNKKVIQFYP